MELNIEKLIYGGDGLGRLPADEHGRGKAVFVPFVIEDERVEVQLTESKPGFARGRAGQVLEPSPHRVQAGCPYFVRCGGCQYQHIRYEHQLEAKAAILKENLRRVAKVELPCELQVHASPPWNYRNRTRMRVQTAPEFTLGYYRFGSHDLLPVETCPISSPLINRAIAAVWELGRSGQIAATIREIEFFANADDSQLLLEIFVESGDLGTQQANRGTRHRKSSKAQRTTGADEPDGAPYAEWAKTFHTRIPGAIGAVVFRLPRPAESHTEPLALAGSGSSRMEYKTTSHTYRVSAGAFFQVNRFLADELIRIAIGGKSGGTAIDLYAGVGLFSAVLSREFERVIAVESSQQSATDLTYNAPGNVKSIRATVEEYASKSRLQADLIVADPPRGGLGERVARAVADSAAPALTYVSCDPATLSRDLVTLLGAGYRIEQAHLVDLFPQTFHLESVLHLTR